VENSHRKKKEMDIKIKKNELVSWENKSSLSLENKLLLYKAIINQSGPTVSSYGAALANQM
jgi:hypothetical protein